MKAYDLTKAARKKSDICADYDHRACRDNVQCHFSCWLQNPLSGICPFLDKRKDEDKERTEKLGPCKHNFKSFGHTPYKGFYTETCRKCGLTRGYEKDYT